ncbi:MAG: Mpo1-like protein [Sandaracinaceae bacterium]
MRFMDRMLQQYRADHRHPLNRATHLIGIPLLLAAVPTLFVAPIWGAAMLAVGTALQLLGHAFEGNAPSFVRDPRFVLVGAAWFVRGLWPRRERETEEPRDERP